MQLSDGEIKKALKTGDIIIEDFDENRLQPASYDVLLGNEFMIFDKHKLDIIDPREDVSKYMTKVVLKDEDDYFVLHPKEFALSMTKDYIGVNQKYACEIMGKSSLARLGLIVHTTAGFIDPGNELNITLEFFNTNSIPIKLYPGMKIGQIAFYKLGEPCQRPYGSDGLNSKYYKARTVQGSQMHRNYKK